MKRNFAPACVSLAGIMIGTLTIGLKPASATSAQFVSHYPACDYKVLDVVTLTGHLPSRAVTAEIEQEKQKLLKRFEKRATERGADVIALIDRKIELSGINNRLWFTAEFIESCNDEQDVARKLTPIAPNGAVQLNLGTVKTQIHSAVTIKLDEQKEQPEIESQQVNLDNGVYGIEPGDQLDTVLDAFGLPSFVFSPSKDLTVISFGRSHWFTFENDKLKKISTESDFFSYRILNEIPFDDRFDEKKWKLLNRFEKGQPLKEENYEALADGKEKGNLYLKALMDEYLKNNQKYREFKLSGFELTDQNFLLPDNLLAPLLNVNEEALKYLQSEILKDEQKKNLKLSSVPLIPIGESAAEHGQRIYLLNGTTALNTMGDTITKIIVEPDLIQLKDSASKPWNFMSFYYNQPLDEALDKAGSDAFYFRDYIEIDKGGYTIKLFLAEAENTKKVYAMELDIFI